MSGSGPADLYLELLLASDEERRRFARRLHDSAQQTLAAISMSLALLERQAPNLSATARETLAEAMGFTRTCNEELRAIAHALHPLLLEGMGLVPALRGLARRLGEARVAALELALEPAQRFDPRLEVTVYKLVEEALTRPDGLFAPTAAVTISADVVPAGHRGGSALALSLRGAPAHPSPAPTEVQRLGLRARVAHGRVRLTHAGGALVLDVRFPLTSPPK